MTFEKGETTPGSLFQCATSRDIPNGYGTRGALVHTLVHLESTGAPEQTGFGPKSATFIAESLESWMDFGGASRSNQNETRRLLHAES